ncbi:MAG TPA: GDP-mannose 4,6-dehydratase [Acidimicrobiales bacterium]|nr:GDP-mannose 4,6-dehydratase [Acidimicrobiales bacterium]
MRSLVTGADGFVGTWLTAHLRESGDEVIGIDHEVNITDGPALREAVLAAAPEAIYHLAALAHVGESWTNPDAVLQVNAVGTLHLLDAARACSSPPRVLLISSAEVYGSVLEDQLPVTEATALAPVTPYAASKVAAEYLGIQAHLAYGLRVIRVRPFNHIGPGQAPTFVVPALAARIVEAVHLRSPSIPVGNLGARRDLTDVRDIVRAYRMLVELGTPGEVYNVCSGRDVAISEVADRLLRLAGADLTLDPDPELMRPVDVAVIRGDPGKLHAATGWQPQLDLDTTLSAVLHQWQQKVA